MLAIIATVCWILFDVAISLLTAPVSMPTWEWRLFLGGGAAVGVVALVGELWDRHKARLADAEHSRQNAELRDKLIKQEGMMSGIGLVGSRSFELLAEMSHADKTEPDKVFAAGAAKISELQHQLEAIRQTQERLTWQPLTEPVRKQLAKDLSHIPPRPVLIYYSPEPDCQQLAQQLATAFSAAGWNLLFLPDASDELPFNGITLVAKKEQVAAFYGQLTEALIKVFPGMTFCGIFRLQGDYPADLIIQISRKPNLESLKELIDLEVRRQ